MEGSHDMTHSLAFPSVPPEYLHFPSISAELKKVGVVGGCGLILHAHCRTCNGLALLLTLDEEKLWALG